ncbi:MAG: chorismate synthase [Clostridia bacterium]|nr:chorismate synthase [Clostridia bacterium]
MSCSTGKNIVVTVFGQSHSQAIGAVVDGVPAGIGIDESRIADFMKRRSAKDGISTARREADEIRIVSGIVDGITCGAPICAIIGNVDTKSSDYDDFKNLPRPSHSDFSAYFKHNGNNDIRGGGNSSGRMTAAICFAGAVCIQLLEKKGIYIGAHALSVYDAEDERFDPVNVSAEELKKIGSSEYPVLNPDSLEKMKKAIEDAKAEKDSVGGVIECAIVGIEAGTGEPMFDGIENKISSSVFAIPAIKGIEFGSGFDGSRKHGSENNDDFRKCGEKIVTSKNDHGGILGGMASGMPVIFRCAVKPVPSIGKAQRSVDLESGEEKEITVCGRHDSCIVMRAVPCIEAAAAIAIADLVF